MKLLEKLKNKADIMFCIFYPCAPQTHTQWRGQRVKPETSKNRSCILVTPLLEGQREKVVGTGLQGPGNLVGAVTMVRQTGRI